MKRTFSLIISLASALVLSAQPANYYNSANGLTGTPLKVALHNIIKNHTSISYGNLWDAFCSTDNKGNGVVWDMYSDRPNGNSPYTYYLGQDQCGNYNSEGDCYNREHSWPQSWFNEQTVPRSDLHHIFPTDGFVNGKRANYPLGEVRSATWTSQNGSKLGTCKTPGYSGTVFEPIDEYKGDFARALMYMSVRYYSEDGSWSSSDMTNKSEIKKWAIDMLLRWNEQDPVSEKEKERNEVIYNDYQHNRNPFVDHPELVEYIWGTKQNTSWTGEDTPEDTIVKIVPVMQAVDTTAVTGHSFRADWSRGGDVSSYTLKVNRLTQGEAATLMMSENFSNVNATADGSNDISSQLDRYTDNPGWTGYKLYTAANQSLKVGTSNAAGYLVSPELELGNTVTVVFNAKNWISSNGTSDASSVIVSCGNARETVTITDSPADYTVVLRDCDASNIKLEMIAAKKRFYIYSVDIYNGDLTAMAPRRVIVEEGDSTWRNVSGITDTCYTVQGLAEGVFEYMVKAIYTDGSESVWSNIQHVTLTGMGGDFDVLLGDVDHDGVVGINDVTVLIDYILSGKQGTIDMTVADVDQDDEISISDVTGIIDLILEK